MSSLIYHVEQDQVFIATDTLATTTDGKPAFFTSKVFTLPHLKLLICGTGYSGFLGTWLIHINDRMVVRGIDNLNYHTPKALNTLWCNFQKVMDIPSNKTTTIYHFGFSEKEDIIHSYVYRSSKNFVSESREDGIGIKPECTFIPEYEFPTDIPRMMVEQRMIQKDKPVNEKVYIGGEIMIHHLNRNGIMIYSLGKFDDFEEIEEKIFSNYSKFSKS